jgi:hypothetical protein
MILHFEATVTGRHLPDEFEPRGGEIINIRLDKASAEEDEDLWEMDMDGNRIRKRKPGGAMMPPVGEQSP